ncbi:MAG: class I SAM-dependent methyltransferase [Acidobacteria bacterium]|nr:class I SAM-dependent methyltransferase [Acidobacteriota bacterium]
MADSARTLTDLFGFFGNRRAASAAPAVTAGTDALEISHPTKSLQKFLACLQARENPVLVDLGPVVGSNVTFFGEQLGCRIRVEDLAADIEAHVKAGKPEALAAFLKSRFTQAPESVDGILCWDMLDYLDRPAAQALAEALGRLLRPDGVLLGFFSTADAHDAVYTKYVVVDPQHLRYKNYPASRPRQRSLLTGDIIRMFKGLRVSDSFLMKSHVREMLFRKPTA